MSDRELMQMALDALEEAADHIGCHDDDDAIGVARKALRARLAQPEQEPLWIRNEEGKLELHAPPQREWQGLTDEEIDACVHENMTISDSRLRDAVYGVVLSTEAKLRERNQ